MILAYVLTDNEKMLLTPTYHVMQMYAVHHDAVLLPIQVESEDYTVGNERLKAVSASASKDKAGEVHISLVNVDARKPQTIRIDLNGRGTCKRVSGTILTSSKLQNHNTFERPDNIAPTAFYEAKLTEKTLVVTLPPFSVVVLTLL